jgi:hypothetical protein
MDGKRPRMATRRSRPKESLIQRNILLFLISRGIFCWYVKTVGTYDAKIQRYRKTPWYYRKGVPDIHGFIDGIPFVIEVKSATGKLSPEQIQFRRDFLANALEGVHMVARSVEDVIAGFKEYGFTDIEHRRQLPITRN